MSKKDYIKMAAIIRRERDSVQGISSDVSRQAALVSIRIIATNMADLFAADNPMFNHARFIQACGL